MMNTFKVMRTIALMLIAGAITTAETPNVTPTAPAKTIPPLKTAERLALSDLINKRAELNKQIDAIIREGCVDRQLAVERCRLNDDGTFTEVALRPPAPQKEEKK